MAGKFRQKIERPNGKRLRQLNRIYKRDGGICFRCEGYVAREDASREHIVFTPITNYPHLIFDDIYCVLAHKACNT